ncbi:hypothetical protein T01_16087 [Trichinella spiralis]|uniref:Uncharacterized protein n=1 Tax=Trichinella spiralis TaxID=6334 RepID=A0A0V1B3J5_TRISP|nr:hypothetical protein T01_16087 [Trichinella spiralis]
MDPCVTTHWAGSSGSLPPGPLQFARYHSWPARLRVAIFHVRIVTALAHHARQLTNSLDGLRRSNI